MNVETGQVYRTSSEIEAARNRGEKLAEVSPTVVQILDAGTKALSRRQRRQQGKEVNYRGKKHPHLGR